MKRPYRLLYFAFVGTGLGGVEQKILAQFDALKTIKEETNLFLVSTAEPGIALREEVEKRQGVSMLLNSPSSIKNPLKRRTAKFDLILNELFKHHDSNTILYLRYPGADPLFYSFLKKTSKYTVVTEHQEIENKLKVGSFHGNIKNDLLDFIYGRHIRKKIHGFVGVSSQFLSAQKKYLKAEEISKKFFLVNGNGISVKKYSLRKSVDFDGKIIHLIFIGSVYKSHGLHRLIRSIDVFNGNPNGKEIKLHIIGVKMEDTYLEKYILKYNHSSFVTFHGFLNSDGIDKLANKCHIAINSLGLHRIGISYSSTLKSREYFARGIPYITSTYDDDFDNNNPYILKLKGEESDIDCNELFQFTKSVYKDINHSSKMRAYAQENLDWSIKMNRLNRFLDDIYLNTFS